MYYEVLLSLHIIAAAIWFGGGVLLILLAARMTRTGDTPDMVLKPTANDIGTLIALAAVIVAGAALTVRRLEVPRLTQG